MPETTVESNAAAAPDRGALRARLEATRSAVRELVASISDEQWRGKSGNRAWTCGQMATHLALNDNMLGLIEKARKGKGFNPPMFVVNIANVFMTRRSARNVTRESLLAGFDAGTSRLLGLLDQTTDDELRVGVKVLGEQTTVAGLFERLPAHLAEHEVDLRVAPGRS